MELTQKCDEYESESLNQFLNINKCKTKLFTIHQSPAPAHSTPDTKFKAFVSNYK